jgi:hypothetical protein
MREAIPPPKLRKSDSEYRNDSDLEKWTEVWRKGRKGRKGREGEKQTHPVPLTVIPVARPRLLLNHCEGITMKSGRETPCATPRRMP